MCMLFLFYVCYYCNVCLRKTGRFCWGLPLFVVVRLKINLYLKENLHFIVLKQYNITSKLVYLVSNTFRLSYRILIRIRIFKLIVSKKVIIFFTTTCQCLFSYQEETKNLFNFIISIFI